MQIQEPIFVIARELTIAASIYFIIRYFLSRIITTNTHGGSHRLPPGPRCFPIVGALPLLGNMPHVALAKMAKTYGPIIYLKVGAWDMAVASTPASARAFLKTLDTNFSNRPLSAGATILAYNAEDMVFARYSPKWRLLRKLTNLHMLGNHALNGWASVRSSELGYMLQAMHDATRRGEPVALPEMLMYAMGNILGQVILSRRIFETTGKEVNEFKDMVVELMTSAGYFNIGDFIPWLAWMDLQRIESGMKKLHNKFDKLIGKMMEDHLKSAHIRNAKPDLLDCLLANRDSSDDEKLTSTNVKALLLNLFTAGTDTSSSIVEWALAEMMKNPTILNRAHQEMDRVVGRTRRLVESDIPNLPYLRAICKEAYRKHPSTPLNLPRIASEACVVDGYYIPKNTRLSVNIWAIGRDPDVWENPLDFNPDRFLSGKNERIDPRGNHFELIPFGAGRRICAGSRMGMVLVEYILGTLVQAFEWGLPAGTGMAELDMDEVFGLALQKAVPLTAMLTPRLPSHCYAP